MASLECSCVPVLVYDCSLVPSGAIFRTLLDGTARASVNLNGDTIKMRVKHSQKIIKSDSKNITSDLCNIKRHLIGVQKIITFGFIIITLSFLNITHTSALTYQDEIDMQFTFNPTVQIAVSGDLIIPDLAPGSSSDSNIITVTAGSNDAHGYILYGTVGSSTNNYTDLRLSSSNTTNVFTNLSSNKATLSNFSDNTWGYSYSTDSGSSWVSGSVGSTSSGYNGLPLYNSSNNASGVILASTSSASETSLQFKIGAKAASTQVSGTYTNIINFIGVGKVVTTNYTLTYNGNDAGTGTTPTAQSGSTTDGVITLSETTPTKDGYIFKGWCDTDNSSDPTTCTGTTYNPGRIYVIPTANQGSNSLAINLYAIWKGEASITYYNLTVIFGGNYGYTQSVTFTNDTYGTETVNTSGDTVSLAGNVVYELISTSSRDSGDPAALTPSSGVIIGDITQCQPTSKDITSSVTLTSSGTLTVHQSWGPCGNGAVKP